MTTAKVSEDIDKKHARHGATRSFIPTGSVLFPSHIHLPEHHCALVHRHHCVDPATRR